MPASSHPLAGSQPLATLLPIVTLVDNTSSQEAPKKEALQRETVKHQLIHKPQPIPNQQVSNKPIQNKPQPIQNRVQVLLVHIPKFSIQGQARLAADVGVSRSTISRLVHGRINPSYRLARGVTDALERMLGKPLDMREVFSTDGTYLTPSGCALCQCGGCLPDRAYDIEGNLRPEWQGQRPGDWSCACPAGPGPSVASPAIAGPAMASPIMSNDLVHEGVASAGHEGVADAGQEAL